MAPTRLTKQFLAELSQRVRALYLEDMIPWVVGYSGGKDSTATLQLIWLSIRELPPGQRQKPIYVISTDTLVEQPIVAAWVNRSLDLMKQAAVAEGLPIHPNRLTPAVKKTFWVNLIGKGYPAPRRNFRWCTDRLKIEPSNRFIMNVVDEHREAIVVLGTRKAESQQRAANMEEHARKRMRDSLSPNAALPGSLVYTPIEDWSNDEVWFYLMQVHNPWGISNKDLMAMYRGASSDNECPLVVDTSTPTCGNSRFGCWVCTVVSADKSMEAMIQNDWEKGWMTPLLEFRNRLAPLNENGVLDDWTRRDFRRMNGKILLQQKGRNKGRPVHGPYTKAWRERWLRELLEVELEIQRNGPGEMRDLRLITDAELREIRRIWVEEKHEFDDALPRIYQEVTGRPYQYMDDIKTGPFGPAEWRLLQEITEGDPVFFQLQASMLDVEQRSRGIIGRKGLLDELEDLLEQAWYSDEDEAVAELRKRKARRGEDAPDDVDEEFPAEEGLEIE